MRTRRLLALSLFTVACAGLGLTACHSGPGYYSERAPRQGTYRAPEHPPTDREGYRRDLRSGTLTAGHFDDADDPQRFADWADSVEALGPDHGFTHGFDRPAIQLRILNEHGDPVHNAQISLISDTRGANRTIRSGTDGRCVVLPGYDGVSSGRLELTIIAEGAGTTRHRIAALPGDQVDIVLDGAEAQLPRRLDLALVIDTTGSMSDELEYLKVEFRAIVERIAERYPHVAQRWALVVYRDKGDKYVVKDYDFTGSLGRIVDRLGDQRAAGGGDYPEAVDAALHAANELRWRDDAAKVAFLVADAPPHAERADEALAQAGWMRSNGVALYPVASSGVKAEAEHVFRAAALLTGGAYSFLTDDSGVGNPHAEPHEAPRYAVQRLDDLIVQLVESELSGESRRTRQRDIVRDVPDADPQPRYRTASDQQVRAWRDRRDRLTELLGSTTLSDETADSIVEEIAALDRRISDVGQ